MTSRPMPMILALPLRRWEELVELSTCGYEAIPEDDIVRMHWWGIFHDKPKVGNFCLRIKVPGGILSPEQLRGIGELSVRLGQNYAELTTRQNIQLHWLRLKMLPEVFAELQRLELTSKGGCGDTVRNITGCPLAGINPEELFDPTPLLLEVSRLFDSVPEYSDLPRKHKITITACPNWCTTPEINCVALVGTRQGGRNGFALWAGGGLASTPRLAKSLGVFVEPVQVIPVLRAILDEWRSQTRYRVSRVKARLKFMMDDYGPEGFRRLIEERLGAPLEPLEEEPKMAGFGNHMGVHPQRQPGLFYVGFAVPVGRVTGEQLIAIAELLKSFDGDFRITRQQNFLLTGIPEPEMDRVVTAMAALGFSSNLCPLWANGIACTGEPYCNYGVIDSKEHLPRIIRHLEEVFGHNTVETLNLSIHADGCPHACAQHWVGDLGLQGTTAWASGERGEKVKAFDIILKGRLGSNAAIGRPLLRRIPADQVPYYIERLVAAYLQERRQRGIEWAFPDFCDAHSDEELVSIASGAAVAAETS